MRLTIGIATKAARHQGSLSFFVSLGVFVPWWQSDIHSQSALARSIAWAGAACRADAKSQHNRAEAAGAVILRRNREDRIEHPAIVQVSSEICDVREDR